MESRLGTFYEFFAGAGMVRAGLGSRWQCLFANDFDLKKAATYKLNWGDANFVPGDVAELATCDLPGVVDLAWASFPCQDLSLAGGGAGLKGERSGTFWPFSRVIKALREDDRAPAMLVLENVTGTLSSHGGKDFAAICKVLREEGYRYGAVVVDAVLFVPQSRPRLFVVACREELEIPKRLTSAGPGSVFHTHSVKNAYNNLARTAKESWVWWDIEEPPVRQHELEDLIDENPDGVDWKSAKETKELLAMMSDVNLRKVREAKRLGCRRVGAVYKRTRRDINGRKVQRAEVRFDGNAGCLRTPAGGSSRQIILDVDGTKVRSRLISTRETARLMGLPEAYVLPENYNEAYHLTGDGVVVPVVRFLADRLFEPLVSAALKARDVA